MIQGQKFRAAIMKTDFINLFISSNYHNFQEFFISYIIDMDIFLFWCQNWGHFHRLKLAKCDNYLLRPTIYRFGLFCFCGQCTHAQVSGRQKDKHYNICENHEVSQFQFSANVIFTFKTKTCQKAAVHLVALTEDRNRALWNSVEFHRKRKNLFFERNG